MDADDPAPGSPARLFLAGAGGVLVLLAAVAGLDELRERRAAQEERRLQAVVQVEATYRFGGHQTGAYDGSRQEAVLSRAIGLRNSGPRPVVVESAVVDGLRLLEPVEVAPGREERLRLVQRVPCRPDPAVADVRLDLRLGLRTGAGLEQRVLPLAQDVLAYAGEARRVCGLVPAGEAVQLYAVLGAQPVDGALDVPVRVSSSGARPARIVSLRAGSGMSVELLDPQGRRVPLPLEVEPRAPDGTTQGRSYLLRLRVDDCRLVDASDSQSFQPASAFSLSYLPADEREPAGAGTVTTVLVDPEPVRDLLAGACP